MAKIKKLSNTQSKNPQKKSVQIRMIYAVGSLLAVFVAIFLGRSTDVTTPAGSIKVGPSPSSLPQIPSTQQDVVANISASQGSSITIGNGNTITQSLSPSSQIVTAPNTADTAGK